MMDGEADLSGLIEPSCLSMVVLFNEYIWSLLL